MDDGKELQKGKVEREKLLLLVEPCLNRRT
ncbi:Uncharacterised protein [Vibrio cholerae]|nr:Uncharacterised protein [Vibrio cholerae]